MGDSYRIYRRVGPVAAICLALAPMATVAQVAVAPAEASTPSAESPTDDIIVPGYKARMKLPTVSDTTAETSMVRTRTLYEHSEQLAKCAARSKLSNRSRLHAVVDGEFNTPRHAIAQDLLKRTYITCSESSALLGMTTDGPPTLIGVSASGAINQGSVDVDPAPLGRSIYDRGAFTIAAMQTYAPHLTLSRAQTDDPAVQARFNLREGPLNRHRLPEDFEYLQVAVCIVRVQPTLSVRLAYADAPAKLDGLQATLINNARQCVGNAKHVNVDPTQFRLYIADAVYRWAVAVRGVGSLIPIDDRTHR